MADKLMLGHHQGMAYALKIAKEQGIEALENEIRFRGLTKCPITINRKQFDDCVNEIKLNTFETMLVLNVAVLHDEFGFGQKRCQQYIDRFRTKANCIGDDYCSWQDYIDLIQEELGIELDITNGYLKRKEEKND